MKSNENNPFEQKICIIFISLFMGREVKRTNYRRNGIE
jgi:hypothetical protein